MCVFVHVCVCVRVCMCVCVRVSVLGRACHYGCREEKRGKEREERREVMSSANEGKREWGKKEMSDD